jgi:hypothetical protein
VAAFHRDLWPLFPLILTSNSQGQLPCVAAHRERLLSGRLLQGTKFCSVPLGVFGISLLTNHEQKSPIMKKKKFRNIVAWLWVLVLPIILIIRICYPDQLPEYVNKLIEPISIFTLVLAISTVLLWRDTNGLRRLAAKQSKDMENSMRTASTAANAAKKSADVAEQSLEYLERPFVFISNVSKVGTQQNNTYPSISFNISNYGRFPALVGLAKISARIIPNSEEFLELGFDYDDFDIPPILAIEEKIEGVIYYFPRCIEWEFQRQDKIMLFIPKVKINEVFLLDAMIIYSGGLIKSYVYKVRWKYNLGENAFKLISWKTI